MKPASFLIFFGILLCRTGYAEPQLLDRVVAVVNDEAITQSELDVLLRPVYEQYTKEYQGEKLILMLDAARQKLLNQLIEDRLVFQEAKARAVVIDEVEIDRQIEEFKKRLKDDISFEAALREEGLTVTTLRDRLRRQAMIRDLQDMEIRSKIVVSPTEIENYYKDHLSDFSDQEKIKVRSLTIKKGEEAREKGLTDEESKARMQDIRSRILSGEDFSVLAKEYSEDTNAETGGLTDWIQRGEMIAAIDELIFGMNEGEISEISETPMGYHLFRIEEKERSQMRTLDEVRSEIFAVLFREKAAARFQAWMEDLKRSAYISIR